MQFLAQLPTLQEAQESHESTSMMYVAESPTAKPLEAMFGNMLTDASAEEIIEMCSKFKEKLNV